MLRRVTDQGSIAQVIVVAYGFFPLRTPDRTQQTEPLQSACSPSSCFLRRSGQPSVFSRNEGPDEAKPKTACDDDTSRLVKPACVRISTFLHARRHAGFSIDFGYDSDLFNSDELGDRRVIGLEGVFRLAHWGTDGHRHLDVEGFAAISRWEELSRQTPTSISPVQQASA